MSSALSRSSGAIQLDAALTAAVGEIADAVVALDRTVPIVLIDGRSGSGKSTLARRLVAAWPMRTVDVQLLALDDVYPGWDGLAAGARQVCDSVLEPLRRGRPGSWRRWDWAGGRYAERHRVDPSLPLIVEGCGSLTAASERFADVRVWLDAPAAARRRRALARDGDVFGPHWEQWARQERAHIAAEDPGRRATHRFTLP